MNKSVPVYEDEIDENSNLWLIEYVYHLINGEQ
jgi:hypothetical protein